MYATLPNGIKVFYREAGAPSAPTILLLHGFPSSSHQYRNLITLLAPKYHVIAPDLPGFGFTEVPPPLDFQYTFTNLTSTIASFLSTLSISKFAVYLFDYGAPTAFRLALQLAPNSITAIISQNGNAYEQGLGKDFWAPLRAYWAEPTNLEIRGAIRSAALTFDATKQQYTLGEANLDAIDPATYHLDAALLGRPGNKDIQLDLFRDYGNNVTMYPKFQEYLRESQVPLLAIWGKNDVIFVPAGAEAFKRDLPNAEVRFLDAGHFAVESHTKEIASAMVTFLEKNGI